MDLVKIIGHGQYFVASFLKWGLVGRVKAKMFEWEAPPQSPPLHH